MAHYKRKRPRTAGGHRYSSNGLTRRLNVDPCDTFWLGNYPRWHDKLFHTRPARHRTKALEHAVVKGADADALLWPDGRRPHVYYW